MRFRICERAVHLESPDPRRLHRYPAESPTKHETVCKYDLTFLCDSSLEHMNDAVPGYRAFWASEMMDWRIPDDSTDARPANDSKGKFISSSLNK
jgi:hypothetical protein